MLPIIVHIEDGMVKAVMQIPEGLAVEVRDYDLDGLEEDDIFDPNKDGDGRTYSRQFYYEDGLNPA